MTQAFREGANSPSCKFLSERFSRGRGGRAGWSGVLIALARSRGLSERVGCRRISGFSWCVLGRSELHLKRGLGVGQEDDLQLTVLALDEGGAGDVRRATVGIGVLDGEWTAAAYLEAVVECGAGLEAIGAEAGAGVVDFKKLDRRAGAVLEGGVDVIRATATQRQN